MASEANWTVQALLEHAEWIRKLAHVLVRDPALAEDLAQDTWVAALRTPPKEQGPLKPWLATILRNLVRERARGNERRRRREQAAEIPQTMEPVEDLAQRAEAQRLLVEFVLELAPHYRDVVLLSYFEGLSSVEIAERLGVPDVTVRSRLKRGLDQLRERFDRKYGDRKAWIVMLMPLGKRPGDGAGGAVNMPVVMTKAVVASAIGLTLVLVVRWWPSNSAEVEPVGLRDSAIRAPAPDDAEAMDGSRSRAQSSPATSPDLEVPMGVYEAVLVTPSGVPAADVEVRFRRHVLPKNSPIFTQVRPNPTRTLAVARSGPLGEIRFEAPFGESFDVHALLSNGMTLDWPDRVVGTRERLEMPLSAGLSGIVTRAEDAGPIGDAVVTLVRDYEADPVASTTTTNDGTYRISNVAPGEYVLTVTTPTLRVRAERVSAIAGRSVERNVVVKRRGVFEGELYDVATNAPVSSAEIGWMVGYRSVLAGADGTFRVEGVDFGPLDFLWVRAPGHGFTVIYGRPQRSTGESMRGRIGLTKGYALRGRLVDERGAPAPDVRAFVIAAQIAPESPTTEMLLGQRRGDLHEFVTDASGRFECRDLRSDGVHELFVVDDRFASVPIELPTCASPGGSVDLGDLVIPDPCAVFGRVLDASGAPVPGARVTAVSRSHLATQRVAEGLVWRDYDEVREQATTCDAEGRFCVRWLDGGPLDVRVVDYADRVVAQQSAAVREDQRATMIELRCPSGNEITGTVRDPQGNAVPHAQVYVEPVDGDEEEFTLQAHPDGSFAVHGLRGIQYRLRATAPLARASHTDLGASAWTDHSVGARDVVVTLPRMHWVDVQVARAETGSSSRVTVEFVSKLDPNSSYIGVTSATGAVSVLVPPASEFVVYAFPAEGPNDRRIMRETFVSGGIGERTPISLDLSP